MAASGAGVASARMAGIAAGVVLTALGAAALPVIGTMSGADSRSAGSSFSAQSTPASR